VGAIRPLTYHPGRPQIPSFSSGPALRPGMDLVAVLDAIPILSRELLRALVTRGLGKFVDACDDPLSVSLGGHSVDLF
jgi:hypothetical protein